jgi:hypothetical protein
MYVQGLYITYHFDPKKTKAKKLSQKKLSGGNPKAGSSLLIIQCFLLLTSRRTKMYKGKNLRATERGVLVLIR